MAVPSVAPVTTTTGDVVLPGKETDPVPEVADHVPPGGPLASIVEPPRQTFALPFMAPGLLFTVTITVE